MDRHIWLAHRVQRRIATRRTSMVKWQSLRSVVAWSNMSGGGGGAITVGCDWKAPIGSLDTWKRPSTSRVLTLRHGA